MSDNISDNISNVCEQLKASKILNTILEKNDKILEELSLKIDLFDVIFTVSTIVLTFTGIVVALTLALLLYKLFTVEKEKEDLKNSIQKDTEERLAKFIESLNNQLTEKIDIFIKDSSDKLDNKLKGFGDYYIIKYNEELAKISKNINQENIDTNVESKSKFKPENIEVDDE